MIEKNYQPADIETRMARLWEEAGAFKAGRAERRDAKPFTVVIPPPNVTGSLHMGHALNNTLQDILCRFERMRGRDVLWQPGTDHAGIATQMVVERQLMERQEAGRRDMGRAKFLERVWQWKAESGGVIVNQLKRLGASCDWSRERFTMGKNGAPDDQMVRAVMKAFVDLYNDKLIYKDKRLVNWDPKLVTAISDLEVQQIEVKGSLWYLRYPLADGLSYPHPIAFDVDGNPNEWERRDYIVVATTRPETMLGDTAVAVHPDDARYKDLVAQKAQVILPLVGRKIPIIADEYSDPKKGSGAVKITPAHDFNDFEVGRRHQLSQINVFGPEADLFLAANADFIFSSVPIKSISGENIPFPGQPDHEGHRDRVSDFLRSHGHEQLALTVAELDGVDRFVARKKIVARLEEANLLEKIEPNTHAVPHGDRSGVVIEPYLTSQWYVDAKTLAKPAIAAVKDGVTTFVPKNWEKTYFEWMENIQPWCISRQLWWGHQIPCWYGPTKRGADQPGNVGYPFSHPEDAHRIVTVTESEAIEQASIYYGGPIEVVSSMNEAIARTKLDNSKYYIWRDEDVLDTWFSSGLWPFSTLGWPDETPEMERYYPTNVLVTGWDIIFFWVARMMMMGLHFKKKAPFSAVYIHRLVRDEKGAKMSKSKGNVIDPLGVIDDYGADALRFALARGAAHSHDIKLSPQLVETNRNFATKLWNACRFAEMNGCALPKDFDPTDTKETLNRWIVHRTANTAGVINWKLNEYKFNEAAGTAYQFVWNFYCDWYLEFAKPVLLGSDGPAKDETRATLAWVRDQTLKLLHPFMPFITEELWAVTAKRDQLLTLTDWPNLTTDFDSPRSYNDAGAEAEVEWVIELITAVRSVRAEMNISVNIPLVLVNAGEYVREHAQTWADSIKWLARVSEISFSERVPEGSAQLIVRGVLVALPLKGLIDVAAESARLKKELAKTEANINRLDAKLSNERFIANVPEDVVEEQREKLEEANLQRTKIVESLDRLKIAS